MRDSNGAECCEIVGELSSIEPRGTPHVNGRIGHDYQVDHTIRKFVAYPV